MTAPETRDAQSGVEEVLAGVIGSHRQIGYDDIEGCECGADLFGGEAHVAHVAATQAAALAPVIAAAWAEALEVIGGKVIRLAKANAVLARANGRPEERRWLDLIHALEADIALMSADREQP